MKYADVYVDRASKVPQREHWAILQSQSVHVPGDERSRSAPGHGYPAHSEDSISYAVYFSKDEFLAELKREFKAPYQRGVIGIHVTETFVGETVVSVVKGAANAE